MILIVDDDIAVRSSLTLLLSRAGYETEAAVGPIEALRVLEKKEPELMVMDMNFSLSTTGDEGLFLLKTVKKSYPNLPVILITAWGSIELAVKGMQMGAFDFITKPWDNRNLLQAISTALELNSEEAREEIEVPHTRRALDKKYHFDKIIGHSPAILEVLQTVAQIATTNASVLITGESGTGKELVAEAIHLNSKRKDKPFVKVNLGGVSQSLFESEMFGHTKGAFTDAVSARVGRFEMADGGTIFLDEIGELDPSCQVKLLRVLQDQTYEVLGDSKPRRVDVRVVSATNADLRKMVSEGTFREDLFYRINLIVIHLPALRERVEDIPLLVDHFSKNLSKTNGLPQVRFTKAALELLKRLPYPGNIRELKNVVERSILISGKEVIDEKDIQAKPPKQTEKVLSADQTLEEIEANMIKAKMKELDGNMSQVARALGLSRGALYRRLDKYGIKH